VNVLPGLHAVHFSSEKDGFVCGDGSDAFPSGMFRTADGGKTWRPVTAPRAPGWRAADVDLSGTTVVAGVWSRLGTVRGGTFAEADLDPLGGRAVHAVKAGPFRWFAAGDGGLVLTSEDGRRWGAVNLGVSPAVASTCDFRAVAASGTHAWVAGRPGSVVFHTADGGKTWDVQKTNLTAPVLGLHFLDADTGWAVGELGTIARTTDGGKTWTASRTGGQRAAVLFLHAHARRAPLDLVPQLGLADGYLCAAVGVMAADPATAHPARGGDPARFEQAVRLAGGAAAETAWAFPLPAHAAGLPPRDLLATWDRAHDGKANEQLLRQAVLALRMWQPEVVVTDPASADAGPAEVLVLHAAREAFRQAADPTCFPEQLAALGLQPWAAKKLYALAGSDPAAAVKYDLTEFVPVLGESARDAAEPAARLLGASPLPQRSLKLIAHRVEGAESHTALTDGLALGRGGVARRADPGVKTDVLAADAQRKAGQTRRHLEGLAFAENIDLAGADKALAALGAEIPRLPDDVAARTAYAVGTRFAQTGKWAEAREVFALLTEKYPGHPLAVDGYRWLLRYHAGTEPRRRVEIQQKLAFGRVSFDPLTNRRVVPAGANAPDASKVNVDEDVYRLHDPAMILKWHQACL
ncbi:MAG TPA: YCF48-related protein, partial [Urbifossiella sp.]|nr:YCF48-related protein [Urbifossiella sp.]